MGGTKHAPYVSVLIPSIYDLLVRIEDGRWWIDNGFGVNVLKRYFDEREEAVRWARRLVPARGQVLVEAPVGWEIVETPRASLPVTQWGSTATPLPTIGAH